MLPEIPRLEPITIRPVALSAPEFQGMSDELIKREGGAVAPIQQSFLQVIQSAARDPQVDVGKMQQLLDMTERVMKHDAEVQFNQALRAAQSEMEPIVRDAENPHARSRYARLETIDNCIRGIYTKHGFSLSFNSGTPRNTNAVRVTCRVMHVGGHSKDYELEGDLDTTGAKGTSNKTSIQGLGSSVSYLRRYLTLMIFNLVLTNEDNDGNRTAEYVTQEQVFKILDLLQACGLKESDPRFLAFAGADRIEHIQAVAFERVMAELKRKLALIGGQR